MRFKLNLKNVSHFNRKLDECKYIFLHIYKNYIFWKCALIYLKHLTGTNYFYKRRSFYFFIGLFIRLCWIFSVVVSIEQQTSNKISLPGTQRPPKVDKLQLSENNGVEK